MALKDGAMIDDDNPMDPVHMSPLNKVKNLALLVLCIPVLGFMWLRQKVIEKTTFDG